MSEEAYSGRLEITARDARYRTCWFAAPRTDAPEQFSFRCTRPDPAYERRERDLTASEVPYTP
jgi:hypothetical protein